MLLAGRNRDLRKKKVNKKAWHYIRNHHHKKQKSLQQNVTTIFSLNNNLMEDIPKTRHIISRLLAEI